MGLPGRRHLRRRRRQHRGRTVFARRAVRTRLPDQLSALHRLRAVHRGLPHPRADDDQRVRDGRRQPLRPDLRQGQAAGPAAARYAGAAARRWPRARTDEDYYLGNIGCPKARSRDRRGRRSSGCWPSSRSPAPSAWSPHPRRCTRRSSWPTTMICLAVFYVAAGRAVPGCGAGGRLHRRGDDAVPVRAHADRRGLRRSRWWKPFADNALRRPDRRRRVRRSADRRHRHACPRAGFAGLAQANAGGNVQGLAALIFTQYLWAFELTSALLITAALGAMVLAHRERFERRKTQRELAEERFRRAGHPDDVAQSRCVRPAQRRRHARPAARRLGRRSLASAALLRADAVTRRHGRRDRRGRVGESGQLPLPVGVAVHHRRGRSAVAAQRHRHVHVRRADAQRRATWRS